MTDNGSRHTSVAFRDACKQLDIRHGRASPHMPRTTGKAGRFIQMALRAWAYAKACATLHQRAAELPAWL